MISKPKERYPLVEPELADTTSATTEGKWGYGL